MDPTKVQKDPTKTVGKVPVTKYHLQDTQWLYGLVEVKPRMTKFKLSSGEAS